MQHRRTLSWLTALAALGLGGCAVKVIQLDGGGSDQAGTEQRFPLPFCIPYQDDRGQNCSACYDENGNELKRSCDAPACIVRADTTFTRCLYCGGPLYETKGACLRCTAPPTTDGCTECQWTDAVGGTCQRCIDAAGAVVSDKCDAIRTELF